MPLVRLNLREVRQINKTTAKEQLIEVTNVETITKAESLHSMGNQIPETGSQIPEIIWDIILQASYFKLGFGGHLL